MTDTTTALATRQLSPIEVMRERFIARRGELKAALPSDIDPDHFIRAVTTSAQINPDILSCSFQSVWLACMRACRDGLLPDGREAAIVPFKSTASYIPMYQGLLKNFRKSGQCRWITAKPVRTGEEFEHWVDETGEHFKHVPGNSEGPVEKVYAAALTRDGAFYIDVMSMIDINKVRAMSRASRDDAPWKMWPEEMMKKSALRRISKYLPSGRDVIPEEDDPGLGFQLAEAPPLQPLAPPPSNEPRQPRTAAASLDTFAGSSNSSGDDPPLTPAPGEGGDGHDAPATTVAATNPDEATDTLDHLAESDGDPILAAFNRGKKAKLDGMSRKAIPGEYRDAARWHESIAWQAGFDGKDMPTWNE